MQANLKQFVSFWNPKFKIPLHLKNKVLSSELSIVRYNGF